MADELNDGTGATASTDTGGTNPQAAPDSSSLDPKGASDNGTPPQSSAQTAQQFPFPGTQGAQTPQAGPQSPQAGQQEPSKPDSTPATAPPPPAVQKAIQTGGWTHQVLQALAGGPQTQTTIDPNTGKVSRQEVPLSNQRLGMSIALAALTGAFTGLAQKGPGAEGRAAAGGFEEAIQQKQKQKSDEEQEAAKTYARQAAIANTNFTQHETAQRMGMLDYDFHQKMVAGNQPSIAALDAAGAIQDRGVKEQDLLTKYHITKDMAIVDGTVARMDPATSEQATDRYGQKLWDNTYTVVDPTKKVALSPEMAKNLADHHVAGYFTTVDGKAVPKDFAGSAAVKASLYLNGVAQSNAIDTTEAQLNQQFSRLGDAGKAEGQAFDSNLTRALDKNQISPKDLLTFAKYASMPFDKALDQMRKDKVDPQTIGNISSLVPQTIQDALKNAASTQAALEKSKEAQVALTVNKNNYSQVLADPASYNPTQVRAAKSVRDLELRDKDLAAFGEAANRTQAEINVKLKNGIPIKPESGIGDDNLTHPELAKFLGDENYHTPDGRNSAFLNAMMATDPERAKLIKAYTDGKDLQSYYAAAKKFGGSIAADIHAYDPSFNALDIRQYEKTTLAMGPSGPIGKANKAASTTFVHLNNLSNSLGYGSFLGISGEASEHAANAISEMSNAYANGNKPGENEIQDQRHALGSRIPDIARAATKTAAHDLMEKVRADHNALEASLPRGMKVPGYIDAAGANAFFKMTKEPVDINLIVAPSGTAFTNVSKSTGKLHYLDAHGNDLGLVPGQK